MFDWRLPREDGDLAYAAEYNPQEFELGDIVHLCAAVAGMNDELDWYWVALLQDGSYRLIWGGCDYTGWDCQSWLESQSAATALEAAKLAPEEEDYSHREIRKQLTIQIMGKQPYGLYVEDAELEVLIGD